MIRVVVRIFLLLPLISSNEIKHLTENFFENLEINLKDCLDEVLPYESIAFTDQQVENFVELIRKRQNFQERRTKRQIVNSTNHGNYEIHLLDGVSPFKKIPAKNPKDIHLFQQSNNNTLSWYAATIQDFDKLKIFKHNGHEFHLLHQRKVHSAVRLAVFTTPTKGTFIVVAENTTKEEFQEETAVYRFTLNENLEKVQNLHIDYASDVSIWTDKGDIFMCIVQQFQETRPTKKLHCETQSPIYKWLGGHFDIIQRLKTSCPLRVTPFVIGKSRFLAIANHGVDGSSDTYSELFKYDLSSEQYISYQKIATRGASDIKFFGFRNSYDPDRPQENYIVIANTYSMEEGGAVDYNIKSIIYKYVEGYFLPFQSLDLPGVTEWLPVIGPEGEFVLIAVSKFDGLKTYQYNGWTFQPTENQHTHSTLTSGIHSVRSFNFQGKNVITVSNPENNNMNIFELKFKLENQWDTQYFTLLNWCRSTVKTVSELFTSKDTSEKPTKKRQTNTSGLRAVEADLSQDENNENNLAFLEIQLENQERQLNNIEIKINDSSEPPRDLHIVKGDVLVKHLIINNEVLFNEIIAKTLNDIDVVAFLSGIIPLDYPQGKNIPRLELDTGTIETLVTAGLKTINGRPMEDLLHKNIDNLLINDLIINGNFSVRDLQVKGLLNGLSFNSTNVLLKEGDQFFIGNLTTMSVNADNVTARFLNNLNLHTQPQLATTAKISAVDTLSVKRLTVAGYTNNVDLPTLNKYALKTTGKQEITGDYVFNELSVQEIKTPMLNNFAVPSDFVRISEGEYFVHQEVQLDNELHAKHLTITDSLNHILALENGDLDVLRKNATAMQFVDGEKIINEVELLQPMLLQGKINSESLQDLNPVTKISEALELFGDYVITGQVTIEDTLSAKDLGAGHLTLSNLQSSGLKLTDTQIPVHLSFAQQLNTDEIFTETINGIDTHRWVVNGHADVQTIEGWKTFAGDLILTGDTILHHVNQIDLLQLTENILKVDGDQIITGKYEFKNIIAGTVRSPRITLQSEHRLDEMLTQNIKQEVGNAFIGQLSIGSLKAGNVEVGDYFNGINLQAMLEDTLFKGQTTKVSGTKHFENVTIDTLLSRKSINMHRIPSLIKRGEAVTGINTILVLPDGIHVEKIKFGRYFNNMTVESFENNWLTGNPKQIIEGDQIFTKVVVFGNLLIDSNHINDLNLKHLAENSVKINEDHEFDKVTFDQSVTSLTKIDLLGHIENLDIDSIVADGGEEVITDTLLFKESVTIVIPIALNANVNGFNFSHLCDYSEPKSHEAPKRLLLQNHAVMMKSPIIKNINGKDLRTLENTLWFNDKASNISDLRADTIHFLEGVQVEGYVAETNLQWLHDNYFSKSANQTISADIQFQESVEINGNLFAPKVNTISLNEVNIEEFIRTAILQDWDQVFEEPLIAEALTLNDIQGSYKVNGLNLQSDVMRYDADNIVTGKITVDEVDVEVLNTERNYKVQNVDLKEWTQNGILRTGSYKIEGRTVFDKVTAFKKGIGLPGELNNNKFTEDKVLLKSKAQTITGRKIFKGAHVNAPLFKDIKLKGLINGVNFGDLIRNQAMKSSHNKFMSTVDFHTNLTAQNVNFHGYYQGINITDLLNNFTTNAFVENYYGNYDKLRDTSRVVKKSLNNQANYLNYFRSLQNFQTLVDLVPMRNVQGGLHLATLRQNNHTFIVDFFKWVPNPGVFSIDSTLKEITFHESITNWAPLEYTFATYLYIEIAVHDSNGHHTLGHVLSNQNSSTYEILAHIPSNGTRRVLPLFLPSSQKTCLLLVHAHRDFMDIYCQAEQNMELHQALPIVNALQVEVVDYPNRLEIHAIEKNIQEVSLRYRRHSKDLKREKYPAVVIWTYDSNTELFNEQQRLFTSTPISISAIKHNQNEYLVVASGHLVNTMYSGQIDIKKYDFDNKQYVDWQVLRASAPLQVHLSVLPSNELFLYVLRNSPTDMLAVYEYSGIGKFTEVGTISTLQFCNSIQPFNYLWEDDTQKIHEHFIIAKCNGVVDIVQSVFKG